MKQSDLAGRAIKSLAALLVLFAGAVTAHAETSATAKPPCHSPRDLLGLGGSLNHVIRKIEAQQPITIVALGSSSTAGAGASSPAASYPNQLQAELQKEFPKARITVINKGVNGEEVPDMLRRFDESVIANKPDLLLWQLGTNSLLRDAQMVDRGPSIRDGLNRVRAIGADVILIDPQYAPKVIEKPHAPMMVNFMSALAKAENVGLFRRFEIMKSWAEVDHMPFDGFVIADGLHMNDWGYACMAKGLSMAIAEAVHRPVISARAGTSAKATAAATVTTVAAPAR